MPKCAVTALAKRAFVRIVLFTASSQSKLARLIRLATEQTVRESPLWTRQPGGFRYFSAWGGRIRTPRRRFVEQPSTAEERTHNVSGLHANSAGISVRWTKRHLEVRILSAQPCSITAR